jgi:hypothetical protein
MRYETLESGETRSLYDMLQQRNEDMYLDLYMKADEIKKTSVAPKGGRMKMGNRLTTCLYSYFARQPLMRREDYVSLDHEDLGAYYSCYMQMLEHYEIFEVPSTRQLFSAYMGITVSKFIDLMNHSDPDIKERARELEWNGAEHFFNENTQHIYPKPDFFKCIEVDSYDLVIRVDRDKDGRYVATRV